MEEQTLSVVQEKAVGAYTHTFKEPFSWQGHTFEELTFDFASLTGGDSLAIEEELLLLNKHSVLSRSAIEEKLYPWGEEVSSNSVEVLVHRLRRKLGSGFIKTVHSVGYTLGDAS